MDVLWTGNRVNEADSPPGRTLRAYVKKLSPTEGDEEIDHDVIGDGSDCDMNSIELTLVGLPGFFKMNITLIVALTVTLSEVTPSYTFIEVSST